MFFRNANAYMNFKKFFNGNPEIYWLAAGIFNRQMTEHFDFIVDEFLSDSMTILLLSSL